MVAKKPRIVIVGAGMAGLTAANKLYTSSGFKDSFELIVVEGGTRIGGRINTSEFCGDRIEMGATWIHGIGGSPIHKIAEKIGSLESEQPWECMEGFPDELTTVAEGGYEVNPEIVEPISSLFKNLMDFAQGKISAINGGAGGDGFDGLSVGSFLRRGLESYWGSVKNQEEIEGYGNWNRKLLEESAFAIHENTQRTYTSAGDLLMLDFDAESEYILFPGEEITIAKGYSSIIQSVASVLPSGLIQLGKRVTKIEWKSEKDGRDEFSGEPVKLHFSDGSIILADHVIITVSLGVLKAGIGEDSGLFDPPLPCSKIDAISRLGFGVVNKLFLEWNQTRKGENVEKFPCLQMGFHRLDSEFRNKKIPRWMRKTSALSPIYQNSSVLLSWFAGNEAIELESMEDEEIINGVSTTIQSFLSNKNGLKFTKVLKTQWAKDPLFLGSYSYVAVGSSGEDLDTMAEPLPNIINGESNSWHELQIMFAGEATHRTHYSTTHGAYFSGLREANRLLKHYHFDGF